MARKLKVYRTPIGFHDAYVAASSQKAALKAWGSDADLFSRGIAEIVNDEALTKEPLDNPGKVIRRPRGSAADYMAAGPETTRPAQRRVAKADDKSPPPHQRKSRVANPKLAPRSKEESERSHRPPPQRKPKPRPSRGGLDTAERAIEQAKIDYDEAIADLRRREQAIRDERRALDERHEGKIEKLERALAKARDAYQTAIEKWASDDH